MGFFIFELHTDVHTLSNSRWADGRVKAGHARSAAAPTTGLAALLDGTESLGLAALVVSIAILYA